MDIDDLLLHAFELHKRNLFTEASNAYKLILENDSKNYHAMHYLGLVYLQNGYSQEGFNLINSAIKLAGHYPEAMHNLNVFNQSADAKVIQEIDAIVKSQEYPIFDQDTISGWRMMRMLEFSKLYADSFNSSWLTIGDAFGHDALILNLFGLNKVTASNLDTTYLSLGAEMNKVCNYLQINAEKINLPDSCFNYVLCKEALHHMPRAYMAVYEMLRVAKDAVFLVEPLDTLIDYKKPTNSVVERNLNKNNSKNYYLTDFISYKWPSKDTTDSHSYEVFTDWYEDGAFNYVYTLSEREVRKICYGLGLPGYAIYKFNDIYDPSLDKHKVSNVNSFASIINQIKLQDIFCDSSGKPPSYIICALFKSFPSPTLVKSYESLGFTVFQTPTIFMPFKFNKLN